MRRQRCFCIFFFSINTHFGAFFNGCVPFMFLNSVFIQGGADDPLLWKPCCLFKSIKTLIE